MKIRKKYIMVKDLFYPSNQIKNGMDINLGIRYKLKKWIKIHLRIILKKLKKQQKPSKKKKKK